MKNIANRMIVFAASALALGTVAYGQTNMTAEIPFAFKTASGTQPAGTYQFSSTSGVGSHSLIVRNTAMQKATFAGVPLVDAYNKAADKPVLVFACSEGRCSLTAIRTSSGSLEYAAPRKAAHAEVLVIEIPLKTLATD